MMESNDLPETTFEIIDGVQYEQGLKNIHFVTNKETNTAELEQSISFISRVKN